MSNTEALAAAAAPIACPEAIRAVCDHDGKRWRVEGAGWTMQPEGRVSLGEAETICRAVERALAVPPTGPLAQFFDETFVTAPGYFVLTRAAYRTYSEWCRRRGQSPFGILAFTTYATGKLGQRVRKGADYAFEGVRFRSREDDITPEAVATLQASADAEMKGEAWETVDSPELHTLRDLAHVLDAQIEEGVIVPDGMGLVIAALARVYPDRVHTGSRCQVPECLVHGPCDECPTEVQWARLEGLLMTWLAEHPREVVIHKTASVGRSDQLPDLRLWQPAGAYPVDGTIIEVEGRPSRMRYSACKASAETTALKLGGWVIDTASLGWWPTDPPTGRWRKAPPVRV